MCACTFQCILALLDLPLDLPEMPLHACQNVGVPRSHHAHTCHSMCVCATKHAQNTRYGVCACMICHSQACHLEHHNHNHNHNGAWNVMCAVMHVCAVTCMCCHGYDGLFTDLSSTCMVHLLSHSPSLVASWSNAPYTCFCLVPMFIVQMTIDLHQ